VDVTRITAGSRRRLDKTAAHRARSGTRDASYRRWPMASPRLNAFWRIAPGVRFIAFEILTTGVLLFECALRSRTCSFVQATRLVRLAIKFILFERLSLSTSRGHDKHFKALELYHPITDKSARAPPARFHNLSFCEWAPTDYVRFPPLSDLGALA
jgi:hypothetical protein